MGKLSKFLNDEEWNKLISALADLQIKEMVDQKWYPEEIAELKSKIKARGEWLRKNCD